MSEVKTEDDGRTNGYASIGSYGLLADMGAVALVSTDGAVDWLAAPHVDSPPICAALLDPADGGAITLCPAGPYEVSRRYAPGSMVLQTTFTTETGVVRVTDVLNRGAIGRLPWTELARRIDVLEGRVSMTWAVTPGHALADARPWCRWDGSALRLTVGQAQLSVVADGIGTPAVSPHGVAGEFAAGVDQPALLAVVMSQDEPVFVPGAAEIYARIEGTDQDWRRWSGRIQVDGPSSDLVVRSALTIKALTSEKSGGIAAAATTSLPEKIGAGRNFDYRYSWIRDSSFAIDAMHRLGLSQEVHGSLLWLIDAAAQEPPDLRTFYAIDGSVVSAQMRQPDVPGYRHSQPVNVGNQAAAQTQLGSFGDLLDGVWSHVRRGGLLDPASAALLARLADRTCQLWRTPDAGIWELGDTEHYTISKIGCWVALDRVIQMAESGQLTSLDVGRWRAERDEIRDWVDTYCWSVSKSSYTFHAGTDDLDAAVLLAARTGFCGPDDPRLAGTIEAIRTELTAGGSLLYRYSGQQDAEGAFLVCSCWLVEALAHIGRVDDAAELFADLATRANDLGLYSEQIDPESGELLGNIPQVLSHLGVIGAAIALARGRDNEAPDN